MAGTAEHREPSALTGLSHALDVHVPQSGEGPVRAGRAGPVGARRADAASDLSGTTIELTARDQRIARHVPPQGCHDRRRRAEGRQIVSRQMERGRDVPNLGVRGLTGGAHDRAVRGPTTTTSATAGSIVRGAEDDQIVARLQLAALRRSAFDPLEHRDQMESEKTGFRDDGRFVLRPVPERAQNVRPRAIAIRDRPRRARRAAPRAHRRSFPGGPVPGGVQNRIPVIHRRADAVLLGPPRDSGEIRRDSRRPTGGVWHAGGRAPSAIPMRRRALAEGAAGRYVVRNARRLPHANQPPKTARCSLSRGPASRSPGSDHWEPDAPASVRPQPANLEGTRARLAMGAPRPPEELVQRVQRHLPVVRGGVRQFRSRSPRNCGTRRRRDRPPVSRLASARRLVPMSGIVTAMPCRSCATSCEPRLVPSPSVSCTA